MRLQTTAFINNQSLPERFAFCRISPENHVTLSENINPDFQWANLPVETRSLALVCHDPDVPSRPDDVNKEGRTVSKDLARVDFYHWVLVDIPPDLGGITEGSASSGVVPRGKPLGRTLHGRAGLNNYTDWFAGDANMAGDYGGYDGPCPPWNDEIMHHYHFTLYALSVDRLELPDRFGGPEALAAMNGVILDQTSLMATFSLNPDLQGE
ncbi:YbhB/YbcL family Raf kinase inhibitor-like protein [Aestuariispira insulae]|uniref:PBP family phospholipid-binding protein n=1 Tax=Aestuariispira insulae TaxID=1461337 RepID=A0A3D9HWK7_9PROT|nr:YbhB/YbcL family Raf kinase inhibitor-like protein [Aestuariispira insulae]RED53888.1 PBP family phospholipid-binding protein [Aestuariispira insulae]